MAKILALFVLALAVGSCVVAAQGGGLMQKIGRKFNRRGHHGAMGRLSHGHQRQQGGSAAAAASASATGSQHEPEYQQPQYYPTHGGYYQQHQPAYRQPAYYGAYQEPARPVYTPRYQQHHQGGSAAAASSAAAVDGGSSSASGAASAGGSSAASAAAAAAAKPKFHVSTTPYVNHHHYPQFSRPTYHQATGSQLNIGSEIAAATSAAAASSTGGKVGGSGSAAAAAAAAHQQGAHIPAQYGTQEVWRDEAPIHYVSPAHENVHAAASGVYGADTGINENSYYKKISEEERNHEDGNEESDHYLHTKSHGRAGEENLRIRQGRDDFDQEIGPYSVKTKKRNNFNFVDYNKSESETGSSVLQKDRHRSAYNKDTVKSREEIDAASTKYANGRTETSGLKTKSYVDDEDSEYYDSAGVHGQTGYQGGAAAAASAAATAGSSASSSSASVTGKH